MGNTLTTEQASVARKRNKNMGFSWKTYLKRYWTLYLLLVLPIAFFIVFRYTPMAYILLAFKKNNILQPPWQVAWAKNNGFEWFIKAFNDKNFLDALRNTIVLNLLDLIIGSPMPIIMAILLNELAYPKFKRITQTVLYLPHFLSWVIISSITLRLFATNDGLINKAFGTAIPFVGTEGNWRATYIILGIWKECGWNTIIYLAALTAISPELYEAAEVDGAGRLRKIWHVTLPGIRNTIAVMLILESGNILSVSFNQIYILINDAVLDTGETLDYFVYRMGLSSANNFSVATAVSLIKSIVGLGMILGTNLAARKLTDGEGGIW